VVYPDPINNQLDVRLGITRSVHTFKYRTQNETDEAYVFSEFWGTQDVSSGGSFFDSDDVILVIFSQQIPLLFAGFASAGVIALYVGVVFAIGRLLRTAFGDLHSQIQWYFLEDTKPLFRMCQYIIYARRFHLLQEDEEFQDIIRRAAEFDDVNGDEFKKNLEFLNNSDGFSLEEELYWKVINICRNPKQQIQYSTPARSKEKLE